MVVPACSGYSYSFGHTLHAPGPLPEPLRPGTFKTVTDGRWVLHVWAQDHAGNWSKLGYFKFNIDNTAPKIAYTGVSTSTFNPYTGADTLDIRSQQGGQRLGRSR